MAKKATSKDYQTYSNWQEAQNLSSYGSRGVPNKPVATGGKKTVPEVLDWGKGIPKDYLAYLNKQEMALVQNARKFKGKRNYKGIPAYPDPGDTAAGDTGQGTSSSAGLGNNTSPGGYHSTDTRYGNSTGTSTAGAGTGGGSDSGGGIGGLGGSSSTNSGVGSERASETAGGTTATGTTNADSSAMQSAAESDAATVSISSPALRRDAASGGINSIGIGPENNKINITNPSESSISGAIARSASAYKDVTPTSPGGGGMGQLNARRGSETVAVGPTSGTSAAGNIDRGSVWGTDPRTASKYDSLQADLDKRALTNAYETEKQQDIATRVAEMNRLQAMPDWQFDENKYSWLKAPDSPYGPELSAMRGSALEAQMVAEDEARMANSAAAAPQVRPTIAAGTFTDPYEPKEVDLSQEAYFRETYPRLGREGGGIGSLPDEEKVLSVENVPEEDVSPVQDGPLGPMQDYPKYVTPEEQAIIAEQEKLNRYGISGMKRIPGVGPALNVGDKVKKLFTGSDIADEATNLKNEYMQSSPEKQAEMRAKYPDIRRFAVSIGQVPPNTGTQSTAYGGGPSYGQGGQDTGSRVGILALEAQERLRQKREAEAAAAAAAAAEGDKTPRNDRERYDYGPFAGGRPAKYYQWDLGMRIPKPGDPDYNEYRYYLRQRRVNYA